MTPTHLSHDAVALVDSRRQGQVLEPFLEQPRPCSNRDRSWTLAIPLLRRRGAAQSSLIIISWKKTRVR